MPLEPGEEELLAGTGVVSSGETTPLVIYQGKLYLHRYFNYEMRLSEQVGTFATVEVSTGERVAETSKIFEIEDGEENLQKKAAELALNQSLAIISGGPGTGKTTTVVRIIALLLQSLGTSLRVALAAPTGKAAMRLRQSVQGAIAALDLPEDILRAVPDTAQTLHRLLGVRRNSPQFRHNSENPLDYDVVVVDEASMVDLALMSKLFDALPPYARLILLGDKDQLASVESGAVLTELTDSLPENTVVLTRTYRFNEEIKELAEAIKNNAPERAWNLLDDDRVSSVHNYGDDLAYVIKNGYSTYNEYVRSVNFDNYASVFTEFNRFRILCGVRGGRRGVENINSLVEQHIMTENSYSNSWYPGRPVMINRNDYGLGLFNGDIGICLEDKEDGLMKVWFEHENGALRPLLPYRLPEHTLAYGMTIHKSQGSEFDDVVIILPEEDSPVLSRELIYTGVTRAKNTVWMSADQSVFYTAVSRKTVRSSGLGTMLEERKTALKFS